MSVLHIIEYCRSRRRFTSKAGRTGQGEMIQGVTFACSPSRPNSWFGTAAVETLQVARAPRGLALHVELHRLSSLLS